MHAETTGKTICLPTSICSRKGRKVRRHFFYICVI
nr:MAG TPA: hypothetical protein [Caudoviricetes sp.]